MKKTILILTLLFFVSPAQEIFSLTYYSQGSLEPHLTSSWNTARLGGGFAPTNFTTDGNTFVVQITHMMVTSQIWAISGTSTKLLIENGGTLVTNFAITLSATTTFQIDDGGTYIHKNIDVFSSTIFQGIEIFSASSNVEYVKWNSTSPNVSTYGNLKFNGIATGTSTCQFSGITTINGNLVIQLTGGGTKEVQLSAGLDLNLTISGNLDITGGILEIACSTGSNSNRIINIGGSFNQTGGTLKCTGSSNPVTINFTGSGKTFTQSAGTLINTNINWAINNGASLSIANDLPVAASRTLTVNGNLYCGSKIVSGTGSFVLASGGILGIGSTSGIASSGATGNIQTTTRNFSTSGNYIYNGLTSQVTGNGLPSTVNNLTIDNSTGVSLSGNTIVNGIFNLTSGNLTTNSNTLSISSLGSVSRTSGHVIGNLKKYIATGATSKTFEVGTTNGFSPANIVFSNVSGAGDLISYAVQSTHPNVLVANESLNRYWSFTNSGIAFDSYGATFSYLSADFNGTQFIEATDEASMVVGKYTSPNWSFPDIGTRDVSGNTIQVTGITSFSDFTMGKSSSSLPVELSLFSAAIKFDNVYLRWKTATEINNYGFELYRSTDKKEWIKLVFLAGAGNSYAPHNYSYEDNNVQVGKTYFYRLKQTDNDGDFKYYDAIEVKVAAPTYSLEQNYPNPFNPETVIKYTIANETKVELLVYSITGELIKTLVNQVQPAGYYSVLFNGKDLASGMYIYQFRAGGIIMTRKMVLVK